MRAQPLRWTILSGFALGWATPETARAQDSTAWVRDNRGCLIYTKLLDPGVVLESSVPCVAGRMNGTGSLRFSRSGITTWQFDVNGENGLMLSGGRYTYLVPAESLSLQLDVCEPGKTIEGVLIVPDAFALFDPGLADTVTRLGMRLLEERCPDGGRARGIAKERGRASGLAVYQRSEEVQPVGSSLDRYASIYCTKALSPSFNCSHYYSHKAYDRHFRNVVAPVAEREREALARAEELKRTAAARRAEAERANRYSTFARASGVTQLVQAYELQTNPFPYKGKVVGVVVRFSSMRDETSAWFDDRDFVVTRLPSTLFRNQATVLLAARVLGTVSMTTLGTEMTVPQLQYVGAHFCREERCKDILPR